MSALQEFQNQHGLAWSEITHSLPFASALALANAEKIQGIMLLSDDEIHERGTIILSDLRGHLKYEAALMMLSEKKELVFQGLGEEEYPNPIDEAAEEDLREQQRAAGIVTSGPSDVFRPTPSVPKQKKKPTKRKKK